MLLIKKGNLIQKENQLISADILVCNGMIEKIGTNLSLEDSLQEKITEVVEGEGLLVLPGLIDAHVHLRQPGFEEKETIRTGTLAAARGGFTTVMPMPNLRPAPDTSEIMADYKKLLDRESVVRTAPYACITKGQQGKSLVDMKGLLKEGAWAFSDDGVGVQDSEMMERAMEEAAALGAVIAAHTEDNRLKNGGYVHDGPFARSKGWKGIPSACEYAQIERDLQLVRKTGCHYHVCHVSAKESVALIREAKKEGLPVTAEVTPHHLLLCDEDVKGPMEKMNPPLRSASDRQALVEGLSDGTLDIIATDHAPHTAQEKSRGLEQAPFGIVGLETAFPLLYTKLVKQGVLSLEALAKAMTEKPAAIFGFSDRGKLLQGCKADLVLIDLDQEKPAEAKQFASKGKNTPFDGWHLRGFPVKTIVGGNIVWEERR